MLSMPERTDITNWLIHFTRAPNYSSMSIDALRQILITGGLKPGPSIRKERTTIYGGRPVVCFTEMTPYHFSKYVKARGDYFRCAPYGICMHKEDVFSIGGRPVIYGLSKDYAMERNEPLCRIIDKNVLPLNEQYRYVAYDPSRIGGSLDWTHEREWRWQAPESMSANHTIVIPKEDQTIERIPGIPLISLSMLKIAGFSRWTFTSSRKHKTGIIVKTEEAATQIEALLKESATEAQRQLDNFGSHATSSVSAEYWDEIFQRLFFYRTAFIVILDSVEHQVESLKNTDASKIEYLLGELEKLQVQPPGIPSVGRDVIRLADV